MKYEQQIGVPFEVPLNTPLWATDYLINDDNLVARLKCQPILGEVISIERFSKEVKASKYPTYSNYIFVPYKIGTTTFRNSGFVDVWSRHYADTEEEAIEIYNELVQKRIDKLLEIAEQAKGDFIK